MNCLLCYRPLDQTEIDYHQKCISSVFGVKEMPLIDIDEERLASYAKDLADSNTAITGVQPKLSLWLEEGAKNVRFTIVDHKSNYIIKPQSENYRSLPENEDLCMHMAVAFGIEAAVHGLVRLSTGNLAYVTKRFERSGENKLACEDLCQLTETLTEHKDRGSYEKAGKTILQYSTQAGLDALHYFELLLFSFITGNADMHLKNFSMLERAAGEFSLSPAYDLVSTFLAIANETEQMSLTINGKKNRITRKDFDILAKSLSLSEKQQQNTYRSFLKRFENAAWWIHNSFIADDQKENLFRLASSRLEMLTGMPLRNVETR